MGHSVLLLLRYTTTSVIINIIDIIINVKFRHGEKNSEKLYAVRQIRQLLKENNVV